MPDTPRLTGPHALATLIDLGGVSVAAGVIARRRPVVGLLERLQADRRTLTRMRALRRQFGSGPVELAIPGRRVMVILDPADVGTVLDRTPSPFHPASWEKRRALDKFQPHGVLISRGPARRVRRELNEAALDTDAPMHHLAPAFAGVIAEEMSLFSDDALRSGGFTSADFTRAWWRLVRRLVLGDGARDDDNITDLLWRLRRSGNWSFLGLPHTRLREKFFDRLNDYADAAPPDTLLGALTRLPAHGTTDPIGQVPHWLFAFDAAGMAVVRAAAVLASRPEALRRCETAAPDSLELRPYLRGCVMESVRLWPTTPALLRELTEDTALGTTGAVFRSGSSVLIAEPAFHRDTELLPFADDFVPDIWLDGRAERYPQLVPFSAGPAACPGRNIVLFTTSTALAALFSTTDLRSDRAQTLAVKTPLPMTLNQFGLTFTATRQAASAPT